MSTHLVIRRVVQLAAALILFLVAGAAWELSQDWHNRVQRWFANGAFEGSTSKMRWCLVLGALPNGRVAGTGPALTCAALAGRLDSTRFLLAHGAHVDIRDKYGETPLMVAAHEGDLELVRLLLAAGADPNIVPEDREQGPTVWDEARDHPDVLRVLRDHGAKPLGLP